MSQQFWIFFLSTLNFHIKIPTWNWSQLFYLNKNLYTLKKVDDFHQKMFLCELFFFSQFPLIFYPFPESMSSLWIFPRIHRSVLLKLSDETTVHRSQISMNMNILEVTSWNCLFAKIFAQPQIFKSMAVSATVHWFRQYGTVYTVWGRILNWFWEQFTR